MTHTIAKRNLEAKVTRSSPERLARLVGLLSRHWVDPDMAGDDMGDRRLAISKAYLVNTLGLLMFIEPRVKEGLRPLQIHHLPKQTSEVVRNAMSLLSQQELDAGVGAALQSLVDQHPHPDGGWPEKPGWTREEAKALGIVYESRGGDGKSLKEACLKLISEVWLSCEDWNLRMRTTRLPAVIEDLENDGYDISVDYRNADSGSSRPHAVYHYFLDPVQRAEWNQAEVQRKYTRQEQKAKAEAERLRNKEDVRRAKVEERVAKKVASRARVPAHLSGGSAYGGYVSAAGFARQPGSGGRLFTAPPGPAPRATVPPAQALMRLQANPAAHKVPTVEVPSPAGVPANELNAIFPRAGSRDEVVFDGAKYIRRCRPLKVGERVTQWQLFWDRAAYGGAAAGR